MNNDSIGIIADHWLFFVMLCNIGVYATCHQGGSHAEKERENTKFRLDGQIFYAAV